MSTNSFLRAFQNAAAFNNSQYGPTGSWMDMAMPALDFLSGAHTAYQSGSQGGNVIPALKGMAQGMARRKFMGDMNQRYQQEREYQRFKDSKTAGDNRAVINAATGLNVSGYGSPTDYNSYIQHIRENNQNENTNRLLRGEALQVAPDGSADPQLVRDYMQRYRQAIDYRTANPSQFIQHGQQAYGGSQSQGVSNDINQPGNLEKALNPGRPSFGDTVFTLGASHQTPPPRLIGSPYNYPADVPKNVTNLTKAGLSSAHDQATLGETKRYHQATENVAQAELVAKKQGGYFTKYPPQGPQITNASAAHQMFQNGELSPEEYKRVLGADPASSGQKAPTGKVLEELQYLRDDINQANGAGWFNAGDPDRARQLTEYHDSIATKYGLPTIGQQTASPTQIQQNMQQQTNQATQQLQIPSFRQFKQGR